MSERCDWCDKPAVAVVMACAKHKNRLPGEKKKSCLHRLERHNEPDPTSPRPYRYRCTLCHQPFKIATGIVLLGETE